MSADPKAMVPRDYGSELYALQLANTDRRALIDRDLVPTLGDLVWRMDSRGYAYATFEGEPLRLHHVTLGFPPRGLVVDHINGDRLDNRRSNLRFATLSQSQANRRKAPLHRGRRPSSIFKGVVRLSRGSRPWGAQIGTGGRTRYLGSYRREVEAAAAYDLAARRTWRGFALLNLGDELRRDLVRRLRREAEPR